MKGEDRVKLSDNAEKSAKVESFEEIERKAVSKLEENPEIKKDPGDDAIVYCHEPYAQDLYDAVKDYHPEIGTNITKNTKVQGKVVHKNDEIVEVNCGKGKTVFLDKSTEDKKYFRNISEGDSIILKIKKMDHPEFGILGSHTEAKKEFVINELLQTINDHSAAYSAKVKEHINGGFICDIDGVQVFMPGSLASMNKVNDFDQYIGKELGVIPVNYQEGYVIVSHKEYLKTFIPHEIEKLSFGEWYEGKVTGTTKFGIFVEFHECLTGLIHVDDLDERWADRFKKNNIKPEEEIGFYLKNINTVKGQQRLILTRRKEALKEQQEKSNRNKNATKEKIEKIEVPCEVAGEVENVTNYGLFVKIDDGVTGLVHKSELDEDPRNFEKGDRINVNIYRVDPEDEKIHMKPV